MKILVAQLNTTPADIPGNLQKALEALEAGRQRGVDLVVFPEMTFAGFPVKDNLLFPSFLEKCEDALEAFARATEGGPVAIVGHPQRHDGCGHGLHNTAVLCRGGTVEARYRKWLLPCYDVHDEPRYFDGAGEVAIAEIAGKRVALTVCEDIWNDEGYWTRPLYPANPIRSAADAGADVIVNISAAPYAAGKREVRRAMICDAARRHGVAMVLVNLAGANDELIYDGSSMVVSPAGETLYEAEPFLESLVDVDLETVRPVEPPSLQPMEELRQALVLGIRDYLRKTGFRSVMLGLSGGMDSALVAALAAEAIGPANVHGVAMPTRFSSDHSKSDAEQLAANLGIQFTMLPIEPMFEACLREISPHFPPGSGKLATENMQSRLRGLTLMSLSNASGALVLATGNKSEVAVGYATLYGDMCGGLAPIADVLKTRVYELARHINKGAGRELIPDNVFTKPPSAELAPDQKDTDSLPPYEVLDPIIREHMEERLSEAELVERGHDRETVRRVLALIRRSEYKRHQSAPVLKVTTCAFGPGWRMPIAGA